MPKVLATVATVLILSTSVAAQDVPFSDPRPLLTRPGIDDLGVTYGHLLTCMRDKPFPNDLGPRKVTVSRSWVDSTKMIAGTAIRTLNNSELPISIGLHTSKSFAMITSVEASGKYTERERDKFQVAIFFLTDCPAIDGASGKKRGSTDG